MKKIKLLVALPNHELPPRAGTPGIGTLIHRQLQAMDYDQFEITALCNATDSGDQIDTAKYQSIVLTRNTILFGLIRMFPERIRQYLFGIGSVLKTYRCLRIFLWILIRTRSLDAIVLHNYTAPAEWLISLKKILRFKAKVIYYFHSSGIDSLLVKHKRLIKADGLITIAGEESRLLDRIPHINIINNYCRKTSADNHLNDFSNDYTGPLRLISSSNIDENKGIDIIIDAIQILQTKQINVKLDIYGAVKNNQYFKKIRKKIDFSNNIKYLGYLNNNKLLHELKNYDIAVLLSQNIEGNSMSAIEAIVEGRIPLICSAVGGNGLIMNEERFGFLIKDYTTPDELAGLLSELSSDRARLSEKKQYILTEADAFFSPQKSADLLASFLKKIIA